MWAWSGKSGQVVAGVWAWFGTSGQVGEVAGVHVEEVYPDGSEEEVAGACWGVGWKPGTGGRVGVVLQEGGDVPQGRVPAQDWGAGSLGWEVHSGVDSGECEEVHSVGYFGGHFEEKSHSSFLPSEGGLWVL